MMRKVNASLLLFVVLFSVEQVWGMDNDNLDLPALEEPETIASLKKKIKFLERSIDQRLKESLSSQENNDSLITQLNNKNKKINHLEKENKETLAACGKIIDDLQAQIANPTNTIATGVLTAVEKGLIEGGASVVAQSVIGAWEGQYDKTVPHFLRDHSVENLGRALGFAARIRQATSERERNSLTARVIYAIKGIKQLKTPEEIEGFQQLKNFSSNDPALATFIEQEEERLLNHKLPEEYKKAKLAVLKKQAREEIEAQKRSLLEAQEPQQNQQPTQEQSQGLHEQINNSSITDTQPHSISGILGKIRPMTPEMVSHDIDQK